MFKHKSTSGSNCFVTFILPEGALFVYQLFAEQSIILNLKQRRNPVSTEFLFCYLTEFCPSLFVIMGKYVDFVEDKYGLITLKRPEKRHAIHTQMAIELHSAVQQAKRTSIPFLVITSEGSNYFCAGGDLN